MKMNRPGPRRELAPVEVLTPLPTPQFVAYAAPPPDDGSPGMLSLADHLLQHGRLFAGVLVGALVLGLLYLLLVPPVWQAETLVQIDGQGSRPLATSLAPTQRMSSELVPPQGFVQGEIEILRSRENVARAIAQTGADIDIAVADRMPVIGGWWARQFARGAAGPVEPPAPWLDRWSWGGETLRLAAIRVPGPAFGEPLWLTAGAGGQWTLQDDDDRLVARGGVGAAVPFTLDGQGASIQVQALAARPGTRFRIVPNNPGVVHDRLQRNLRVEEAGRQSGVIRASFADTDPHFAIAMLDAITSGYLAHHRQVSTGEASRALEFLDRQLPVVKRELDRAEEALNTYRTGNNTINIGQESENALRRLGELEKSRVEVELKRQELTQRYTPEYPGAVALSRQLRMLDAESARLKTQMRQAPRQERDVVRLQRDVAVNTQLYTALVNNAQELRLAQAGMSGNARLVDAAGVLSQPVRPRPGTVLSVSAGLGLIAALAAVLLARALRPTLRTAEELERHTGRETIATVPESALQRSLMRGPRLWRARLQQRLLAARAPADPAVEGLRALRNSVALREHDGRGGQTVLVTAPTTAAGKSFVAANLAVLMAAANRRVLLVDMDLRAPRLQVYFGIPRDHVGIADVLSGRCELADAIIPDVLPGLDLLPAGRVVDNPGELMLQPQLETVMDELRAKHAQVLIDSAPVLPVGDTLALGRLADVTYLVVRSEANTRREIRDALRRLDGTGAQVEGLVLNGVNRRRLANVPYSGYFPPGGDARALPVVVSQPGS